METRSALLALGVLAVLSASCKGNKSQGDDTAPAASASASASAAPPADTTPAPPPSPPAALGPFEGSLTMRVTPNSGAPYEVTFQTKGDKLRVDMPAKNGKTLHSIYDGQARTLVVLSDSDKTATTTTLPADGPPPEVKRSGVNELLQGRGCEEWDVTEPTGKHEALCVSPGIPFIDFGTVAPEVGLPPLGTWMRGLADAKGFPLRAVVANTSGAVDSRTLVTGFNAHAIPDAQFAVPPGYKAKH